jgi:cytochrome oxidase Cu insertion factor (SCO1/SenC/PrrC family)
MKRWMTMMITSLAMMVFTTGAVAQQNFRSWGRADNAPKVGDMAPTFKLKSLDGTEETDLEQFREKKPIVLFFGSYT